jgi:hypothetical protein
VVDIHNICCLVASVNAGRFTELAGHVAANATVNIMKTAARMKKFGILSCWLKPLVFSRTRFGTGVAVEEIRVDMSSAVELAMNG